MTIRIAMWSGPRNISTAMMRSFGSRADTAVCDEPFYGAYLKTSRAPHPMAGEVMASMECDWNRVAASLAGPAPDARPIWYQKHMSHHMVGPVHPDDLVETRHAFLIRAPERMIASYLAKREAVTAHDLGLATQRAFFEREADRTGKAPPVVDAADVLREPASTLAALCAALGIAWDPAMLSWEPGYHATDGAWAPHWYGRVIATTGFGAEDDAPIRLSGEAAIVERGCADDYAFLRQFRVSGAAQG